MPEKPVLHGRDHRPGGTDPIPGLASTAWCFAENLFPAALADSTLTTVPLPNVYPSDTTVFGSTTGSGGQNTVEILADGLYVAYALIAMNTSGAPAAGSAGQIGSLAGSATQIGGHDISQFTVSPMTGAKGAHPGMVAMFNIDPASTPAPVTLNMTAQQNSGLSITSWTATLLVVRVNESGSGNF